MREMREGRREEGREEESEGKGWRVGREEKRVREMRGRMEGERGEL